MAASARYAYVAKERSGSTVKYVAGAVVYGLAILLLGGVFATLRRLSVVDRGAMTLG